MSTCRRLQNPMSASKVQDPGDAGNCRDKLGSKRGCVILILIRNRTPRRETVFPLHDPSAHFGLDSLGKHSWSKANRPDGL